MDGDNHPTREEQANSAVEEPESLSTEVNVKVEGEIEDQSETDTLQSKRGLRRKHRAYFFTNDGINIFLRAGMIGQFCK